MKKRQVVIIGAGASGLMAAIMAARNGAAVTVLEQNEKPGKKICATGNGKCNFSNLVMPDDAYRGKHPEFVNHALAQFSVKDTVEFFKKLGIFPLDNRDKVEVVELALVHLSLLIRKLTGNFSRIFSKILTS